MQELLSSASAARLAGQSYYFTGKACKHGHVAKRFACSGVCYECSKVASAKWEKAGKRKVSEERIAAKRKYHASWYVKNKESKNAQSAAWREANKQRMSDLVGAWNKKKRQTDVVFALRSRISCRIRGALTEIGLRKQKVPVEQFLGCTAKQFRDHIERQFTSGMGWHNMSEWHIDHIIPLATAKTQDDVIALSHFTNLRPMWACENISKGAKILTLI